MRILFLAAVVCLITFPGLAKADWTIIHAGELLAVPGTPPQKQASVIIKDGTIQGVRSGFISAGDIDSGDEAVNIIDLSDKFVLPGLIDSHVHLTGDFDTPRLKGLLMSDEYRTLVGYKNAAITLRAGFTTVADLGSGPYTAFALRDAIRDGVIEGPRIIAGGASISVTGGHADRTNSLPDKWWFHRADDNIGQCDGADDCRRRVRVNAKRGADIIKITATGGVMSQQGRGLDQHFTHEEMVAIVETAHLLGLKVTAHAHGTEGIKAAIRAGIDSIEHSSLIDREGSRMAKKAGTYLIPTLMAPYGAELARQAGLLSPTVIEKFDAVMAEKAESYPYMFADGINIAFGTDAGVYEHGLNGKEFARMMEASGMSAMDAIKTATINAATHFGVLDNRGTVEAGKHADIVAVDRSPLEDITQLESMAFVMKGGKVIDLD